MTRGKFISLEGGEGAGKSTQIAPLVAWLAERGITTKVTREPGGSPGAEEIRNLLVTGDPSRWSPVTEALLLYAARRDHVDRTIEPALAAGNWVLCDRFADSSVAYQGFGYGLGEAWVHTLHESVLGNFWPDATLILDVPVEIGLARAKTRHGDEDRYERMGYAFHEKLRQGYLTIAARSPQRCTMIDAARDAASVQADMRAALILQFPELGR
ncbi:dTMP kinase [Roseiterribacter gracilis]|uniref:Thymidylate kinase n=1 Tax=Roseiterribacter gracilis TaxID=2812848 RepID=A0A8S8X7S8_9PROT|nr:thymidylate kinase [Rhodospirillales bacterium TMPK1]